jgi:hypothetical protein
VAEGFFAVKYGQRAFDFLVGHAILFIVVAVALLIVLYIANRMIMHGEPAPE